MKVIPFPKKPNNNQRKQQKTYHLKQQPMFLSPEERRAREEENPIADYIAGIKKPGEKSISEILNELKNKFRS